VREIIISSAVALFLLNGCGGSSSTSDNSGDSLSNEETGVKKTGTGYYVDSAVEGVSYVCGSQSGTTDENGKFTFEEGQNCKFSIGGLHLREINASSLDDNITIIEDNIEVAQLLQTLDMDGNATNGITIDKNATSMVMSDIHIEEVPTELAVLDSIHEALKAENEEYKGKVKTKEEAKAHLDETKKDLKNIGTKTQHDINEGGKSANENQPNNRNEDGKNASQEEHTSQNEGMKDTNATRPTNRNEGVKNASQEEHTSQNEGMKDANATRPSNANEGGKNTSQEEHTSQNEGMKDTNATRPSNANEGGKDASEEQHNTQNEGMKNANENRPSNANESGKDTSEEQHNTQNDGMKDANENQPADMGNNQGTRR